MKDRYGLDLSTSSTAAADAYIAAVDNMLCAGADLCAGFDNAVALDPGFALAEIALARCHAIYGRGDAAKAAAERARVKVAGASRRELQHIHVLSLVLAGKSGEALAAIRQHTGEFARDALVLQPALGAFGLIGFSGRLERELELLALMDGVAPQYGDDWWFNSVYAFAEVDCDRGLGRIASAEFRVEKSLQQVPHNANAAHSRAHVYYELEQHAAGAAFLREWLVVHQKPMLLRGHLAWHLALVELGRGDAKSAWASYDRDLAPMLRGIGTPTPPLNVLTDSASFLWRAELSGEEIRNSEWLALSDFCTQRFAKSGLPYADFHVAMTHARAGRDDAAGELQHGLAQWVSDAPDQAVRAVVAGVARAMDAFAREDWLRAAEVLQALHDQFIRLGGSRAQIDVVRRTELVACRRAGLEDSAQALAFKRPHLLSAA